MSLLGHERVPTTAIVSINYAVDALKKDGCNNVNAILGSVADYLIKYGTAENGETPPPPPSREYDYYSQHVFRYFGCKNMFFKRSIRESPLIKYVCPSQVEAERIAKSLKIPVDFKETNFDSLTMLLGQEVALVLPNAKVDRIIISHKQPEQSAISFKSFCKVGRLYQGNETGDGVPIGTSLMFTCKARGFAGKNPTVFVHVYTPITRQTDDATFLEAVRSDLLANSTGKHKRTTIQMRTVKLPTFSVERVVRDPIRPELLHYTRLDHCLPMEKKTDYEGEYVAFLENPYDGAPIVVAQPFWMFVIRGSVVVSAAKVTERDMHSVVDDHNRNSFLSLDDGRESLVYDAESLNRRSIIFDITDVDFSPDLGSASKSKYENYKRPKTEIVSSLEAPPPPSDQQTVTPPPPPPHGPNSSVKKRIARGANKISESTHL